MNYCIIILAGGFGTRLNEISNGTPKSLMPVGNIAFLDILIDRLAKFNFSKIYLSLCYKSEMFYDYLDNHKFKHKIIPLTEPKPLGTGGAVSYILRKTEITSPFFVVNGDTLSKIDLNKYYKTFINKKNVSMIGVSKVENTSRYGKIKLVNKKVVGFEEKGSSSKGWINNGYYLFRREIFEGYSQPFSLENFFLPNLAKKGDLGAFTVKKDEFIDIGIPKDYRRICDSFNKGEI